MTSTIPNLTSNMITWPIQISEPESKKPILNKPIYKVRDSIPVDYLSIEHLCLNTHSMAIKIIEQKIKNLEDFNKISWKNISSNTSDEAMHLLEKYPDKIDGYNLSLNPNDKAFDLLKKNPNKYNWNNIFKNTNTDRVVDLLIENPDKLKFNTYSSNRLPLQINDKFVDYLEQNFLDKIDWGILAEKSAGRNCENGIKLIVKYHPVIYRNYSKESIYTKYLSLINDDRIIILLKKYPNILIGIVYQSILMI